MSTLRLVSTHPLIVAIPLQGRSPRSQAAKEEDSQQHGATETGYRRRSTVGQVSTGSWSTISLPLRPAQRSQKRSGDATADDDNHDMKRARVNHDAAQARPKDTGLGRRIFSDSQNIDAKAYMPEEKRRHRPHYLDHDQRRPRKQVLFEDAPRSKTRPQERRPRMTAVETQRSNIESGPQVGAKHKEKVKDIRERIDFLDFGYDENFGKNEEFKTPEERLIKYRADVQMLQLHQKRSKLIAERCAAEEAALLFEGRAITAQLMVDVEESRQRANQGAAAAGNEGLR